MTPLSNCDCACFCCASSCVTDALGHVGEPLGLEQAVVRLDRVERDLASRGRAADRRDVDAEFLDLVLLRRSRSSVVIGWISETPAVQVKASRTVKFVAAEADRERRVPLLDVPVELDPGRERSADLRALRLGAPHGELARLRVGVLAQSDRDALGQRDGARRRAAAARARRSGDQSRGEHR